MQHFGKLVRDKIPEIIEKRGERPVYRKVVGEELKFRLEMKITEEIAELVNATDRNNRIEELADVMSVLDAYAQFYGIDMAEVHEVALRKAEKRGSFSEGIYLVAVTEPLTEEEKKQREESERLSRLMRNPTHASTVVTLGYEMHADGVKEIE